MPRPKRVVPAPVPVAQTPVSTPATTTVMSRLMDFGVLVQEAQEIVQQASTKVEALLQGYEKIYLMLESSNGSTPTAPSVDFSTMSSKELRAFMRQHNLEVDDFVDMDTLEEKQVAVAAAYGELLAGGGNAGHSQPTLAPRQPAVAPRVPVARPVAAAPDPHLPWDDEDKSGDQLPDFDEMNVKDLQAFIDQQHLDVTLTDYLTIAHKREAVATAYLGEEEAEGSTDDSASDDENY